jgi:hypothetical protein
MNSSEQERLYLFNRWSDVKLRALTNRYYYQERQRIFELREGMVKALAILGGSVAFSNVADVQTLRICVAAITASSACSLVFNWGAKARDSLKRSGDWALVEKDMEQVGERCFVEADINSWAARCNELEAGEPSQNTALLERSYRRACQSLGSAPKASSNWWDKRPSIIIH